MKITYDQETDTLTVVLTDAQIIDSDEEKPGLILDYDAEGNIVSFEVLYASKRGITSAGAVVVESR